MKRIYLLLMCVVFAFTGCEDEYSSLYTTKYRVQFYFEVAASAELINTIGNPGQYVSIRRKSGTGLIRIENTLGGNDYSLSYIGSKDFDYGLGGLIVGTSSMPNMNDGFDILAYDLACPNCDRAERRLTLRDDGTAKCSKCGIAYDMNNYGVIISADEVAQGGARGLYRYRVAYDGRAIRVFN